MSPRGPKPKLQPAPLRPKPYVEPEPNKVKLYVEPEPSRPNIEKLPKAGSVVEKPDKKPKKNDRLDFVN